MDRARSSREMHRLLVESSRHADGVLVVTLQGEADLNTAPILRDVLDDAVDSSAPGTIVVDLSAVGFIDSMMLGVLLSATRRARARGSEFEIVVTDPHVRRIFELTLLDHVMRLYPSLESALAGGRASGE